MAVFRENKDITGVGGIIPVVKKLKEFGIPQVIRKSFGLRPKQAKYGVEDVITAWLVTSLCGGTRLLDINNYKKELKILKGLKLPSHDTIGRVLKKLATPEQTETRVTKDAKAKIVRTDYDDNIPANRMLIKATKRAGGLKKGLKYVLYGDATFLDTECQGAFGKDEDRVNYSRIGFCPMAYLIGDMPVFISMRSGNAGSRFQVPQSLNHCLTLLEESDISVGRFISDAAGYSKEAFEMLHSKGIKFNVRFPYTTKMETFKKALAEYDSWRETEIETAKNFWKCEVADIQYKMWDNPVHGHISPTWRVVALRIPTDSTYKQLNISQWERQNEINEKMRFLSKKKVLKEVDKPHADNNWKEIDGYLYKFFITNDFKKSAEEITTEYNKRGNAERKFNFLKKDFGWNWPPFMHMNENTVFLIVSALANNIYRSFNQLFKKSIPELRLNSRLKWFINQFIIVKCEIIDKDFYFLNTEIAYEKIM